MFWRWRRGGWWFRVSIWGSGESAGLAFFEESLAHLMKTFEIDPEVVVHDLHPGYLSTEWAKKWRERGICRSWACSIIMRMWLDACGAWIDGDAIGWRWMGRAMGRMERSGRRVLIVRLDGPILGNLSGLRIWTMCRWRWDAAVKEPWRMALGRW